MRLLTIGLVFLLTGSVHAAPLEQVVPVNLPDWLAGASVGAIALFIIMRIIGFISSRDPLMKLADNEAESIKLDRERFEAQKADDTKRNQNISALIDEMKAERVLREKTDATMTDAQDKLVSIKEGVTTVNTVGAENKTALAALKQQADGLQVEVGRIKQSVDDIKQSVGDRAAESLRNIETKIDEFAGRLAQFVSAAERMTEKHTEVSHESTKTVSTTGAAADTGTGASAGGTTHPADTDGGGASDRTTDRLERGDTDPVAEPASGTDGTSAG